VPGDAVGATITYRYTVRHRGFTVHWGPESSQRYLEVVSAATEAAAAGTTVEAAADTIRPHVVDAIGEERLEPATTMVEGATTESESTGLGEEAARKKKQEKNRKKKQRRRQRMQGVL
jgi:hypothetical protein